MKFFDTDLNILFRQVILRAIALIGLISVFKFATPGAKDAALLVFLAPVLVLLIFQKKSIHWNFVFRRMVELIKESSNDLAEELAKNTPAARGPYGFSHVVKMTENHSDSMVRYAGDLYSARFKGQEISQILVQRIESEDNQWQAVVGTLGFLAKMAPYFGMLATVLGMIKLLENMSDFNGMSGSMALAMQGTLFGLISFTLVYSPLQRYVIDLRTQILKRNEIVARWIILIAEQADPGFIQQELRANQIHESPNHEMIGQAAPSARGSS